MRIPTETEFGASDFLDSDDIKAVAERVVRSVGHDAEVFFAELREYGAWRPTLVELEQTIRQLALPLEMATV